MWSDIKARWQGLSATTRTLIIVAAACFIGGAVLL